MLPKRKNDNTGKGWGQRKAKGKRRRGDRIRTKLPADCFPLFSPQPPLRCPSSCPGSLLLFLPNNSVQSETSKSCSRLQTPGFKAVLGSVFARFAGVPLSE